MQVEISCSMLQRLADAIAVMPKHMLTFLPKARSMLATTKLRQMLFGYCLLACLDDRMPQVGHLSQDA